MTSESLRWERTVTETLREYDALVNTWCASAGQASVASPPLRDISRLEAAHRCFVEQMTVLMSAFPSPSEEDCTVHAMSALRDTVVHQVGAIQDLHQLLTRAENMLQRMRERVEVPSVTERRSRVNSIRYDDSECSGRWKRGEGRAQKTLIALQQKYPNDRDLAELAAVLQEERETKNELISRLDDMRDERLKAECAWEAKLSGIMERMEVLERLAGRSSLVDYRHHSTMQQTRHAISAGNSSGGTR